MGMKLLLLLPMLLAAAFALTNTTSEDKEEISPQEISLPSGKVWDKCNRYCGYISDPVCGSDGKTYPNECSFDNAACKNTHLQLKHKGRCGKPGTDTNKCRRDIKHCPHVLNPVCGSNGSSYRNKCFFNAAACRNPDLWIKHEGRCGNPTERPQWKPDRRPTRKPGPLNECSKSIEPIPIKWDPQCGSDGKTYPNKWIFNHAKCVNPVLYLEVVHSGRCRDKAECPYAKDPPNIPLKWDPQCGSDGKTYPNKWALGLAKCLNRHLNLELAYNGRCRSKADPDFWETKNRERTYPNQDCSGIDRYSREWSPVCGTDGNTYDNIHKLEYANCLNPGIYLKSFGTCAGWNSGPIIWQY